MKRFHMFRSILFIMLLISCKNDKSKISDTTNNMGANAKISESKGSQDAEVEIQPISHATMVLTHMDKDIFIDPTGGKEAFNGFSSPEIVLITDIHGDHYNIDTLKELDLSQATVVAPQAVVDKFPEDFNYGELTVMDNGDKKNILSYQIEAIPMYNFGEKAKKFHSKGRGNGYVLNLGEQRFYISGDTEDIPEMRNLKNIDVAFVCMNLPYTMTVESAVSAVLEFKPNHVYPYHYRGADGLSDVDNFKTLVNQGDESIDVVQLNWYK